MDELKKSLVVVEVEVCRSMKLVWVEEEVEEASPDQAAVVVLAVVAEEEAVAAAEEVMLETRQKVST
jgi:hypothetical protein